MAATQTQKPKTETKPKVKETTEPKGRPKHPLVGSQNAAQYPFTTMPTDFNHDKMQPLKKKDFKDENFADFLEYRASHIEAQAAKLRAKAAEERASGASPDKKATKKLLRRVAELEELKTLLGGKGVDVAAIIAAALSKVAATVAPAAIAK